MSRLALLRDLLATHPNMPSIVRFRVLVMYRPGGIGLNSPLKNEKQIKAALKKEFAAEGWKFDTTTGEILPKKKRLVSV